MTGTEKIPNTIFKDKNGNIINVFKWAELLESENGNYNLVDKSEYKLLIIITVWNGVISPYIHRNNFSTRIFENSGEYQLLLEKDHKDLQEATEAHKKYVSDIDFLDKLIEGVIRDV